MYWPKYSCFDLQLKDRYTRYKLIFTKTNCKECNKPPRSKPTHGYLCETFVTIHVALNLGKSCNIMNLLFNPHGNYYFLIFNCWCSISTAHKAAPTVFVNVKKILTKGTISRADATKPNIIY